jgi:RES domain-containing protein
VPGRTEAASAPRIRVVGEWWRLVPARADPLFWSAEPADGRWQRGEVVRALYLADSPETAWAEIYRHSAEAAVPPQERLPRDLWRFAVELDEVADLTDPGALAAHRLTRLQPTRRQWPRTQPIGEAYFAAGCAGLLVPSSAHDDGRVLVVFRSQPGAVGGVRPIRPAKRYVELPPLPRGLRT